MESGYTVVNELPPAFTPDYDTFLFNHPAHLSLQRKEWTDFFLLRKVYQKVAAQVSFHIDGDTAVSPFRAPFGSFLFSKTLSPLGLYDFVKHCEEALKKSGVQKISIKEPPLFYRSSGEMLHTIFFNLGYHVSLAELSSGIKIDTRHFDTRVESWEKRKIKQAKTKGVVCKPVPIDSLETVYHFILKCREQRDQKISMTFEELRQTVQVFNGSFFLFGAFLQKELIAAAITIRVHPGILYNFYSGHIKKFDSLSPVVTLIGALYKFCASHRIHLLDLGTSALKGQPNFSLLDFKLRLGAVPSMKLTFEKELV